MTLSTQLRAMFENSLDGILVSAPDGSIFAANPAACRLTRRSQAEIIAAGRDGLMVTDDPQLVAGLAERARTGRFFGVLTFIRGDGSRFPAEVSSAIYHDEANDLRASVIFRDISERQRADAELRVANENLMATIECSPLAMHGVSPEGFVTVWNKASERLFGWTARDVLGQPNPIVGPEQRMEHVELRRRALAGDIITGVEVQRLRKDGHLLDVSLSVASIKSFDGTIIALLGVLEDIRDRKAAERDRIRDQQVSALRELAVGVRHEMNNTLTALRLELELVAKAEQLTVEDLRGVVTAVSLADRLAAALRRLDRVEDLHSVPYLGELRMLDISAGR